MALLALYLLPLSAHAQTIGGGDVTYMRESAAPVTFSHKIHVDVKSIKCSACHNHIFQMEKDTKKMDMSKISKGEFCGKCHNGKKAFDVKDSKNCAKCHK